MLPIIKQLRKPAIIKRRKTDFRCKYVPPRINNINYHNCFLSKSVHTENIIITWLSKAK